MEVTIVEKSDKIFPTVSENLKSEIYESIEKYGIALKLNSGVNEIVSENNIAKSVQLDNGEKLDFDIALFSIGITPNIDFISSELKTENGKIVVNDKFETNLPDVYAVGDCIFNKILSYRQKSLCTFWRCGKQAWNAACKISFRTEYKLEGTTQILCNFFL